MRIRNFVHGDFVSLLFDDLSGHAYLFTFLMFLNLVYTVYVDLPHFSTDFSLAIINYSLEYVYSPTLG